MENTKDFLARSSELERAYFEHKPHFCCSKYDSRGGIEWGKPSIKHFKIFGYIAYAHVPNK